MASLDQPIPFIERIKDFIILFFESKIKIRWLQLPIFSIALSVLWWIFLSLVHRAILFILPVTLIPIWNFLFIPLLFAGVAVTIAIGIHLIFQEKKSIRNYLDFIFFPLEFMINLFLNTVKKLKEWGNGIFTWLKNLMGKWLVLFLFAFFFLFIIFLNYLYKHGFSLEWSIFISIAITIFLALIPILILLIAKKQIEETLCWLRNKLIEFKELPSRWLKNLKGYIMEWMKIISDKQAWQALVFLLFLFCLLLASLLLLEDYLGRFFLIIGLIISGFFVIYLAILSNQNEKAMENILNFLLNSRPINWLINIYKKLLDLLARLIPCKDVPNL